MQYPRLLIIALLLAVSYPHFASSDSNISNDVDHGDQRKFNHVLTPVSLIDGTVTKVKDGDTVDIKPLDGSKTFTCRLYGIDTPEIARRGRQGQPYGKEAKNALSGLILGLNVSVGLTGDKTYGREVCLIKKNGLDINLEMIKRGYAWAYREYLKTPYASEYIGAEKEAREKGLGLWQDHNPVPPWEFREKGRK